MRDGWVAQHLKARLEQALDAPAIEKLTDHLLYLGTLDVDGGDVPIYLARGLDREKVRSAVDTELRARHNLGIGLVLQAGTAPGPCLAANVLTPLVDQIDTKQAEIALVADKLRSVFRRHRILARGGQTVELTRGGENMATLFVPGKGTIDIKGENRIAIIQRLVDAHNNGPMPMATRRSCQGHRRRPVPVEHLQAAAVGQAEGQLPEKSRPERALGDRHLTAGSDPAPIGGSD